jgi:hypothetical protein
MAGLGVKKYSSVMPASGGEIVGLRCIRLVLVWADPLADSGFESRQTIAVGRDYLSDFD